MKFVVVFTCIIISCFQSFSQKEAPIQSGELIKTASERYDSGDYKKSLSIYQQIDRNDSNYVKALYGMALNYEADSQFNKGIQVCEEALRLNEQRELEPDIYNQYGNLLNHAGQKEKAISVFNEAISKYPSYPYLYFNKGVCFYDQERFTDAESIFKETLLLNPYLFSAHFYLGLCAIQEGKIVPAFLSFVGYMMTNPEGKYSKRCINILAAIANGKDEILEYKSKRKEENNENYNLTEDILLSKIALEKEYKLKVSLDDPIFRQIQVVFEKLEYKEDDSDFWMQYYIPYYKKLFIEEQFEPFIFWSFEDVQIKEIQNYNKKNKKIIDHFTAQTAQYFDIIRSTRLLSYEKRATQRNNYLYSEGVLQGKGELTNDGKNYSGSWIFYFPSGNTKCTGQFDANGREGNWTFYFFSGKLQARENYKNGKLEGKQSYYSEQGLLSDENIYVNGEVDGLQNKYWRNGRLFSVTSYKAGKMDGEYREFYPGGQLNGINHYINNELSGPFKAFYQNGQLKESRSYLQGVPDGLYKEFYENGQLSSEGALKNGKNIAEWKTYYDNGKIKSRSQFVNAKLEGTQEEFYENGAIKKTYPYQKGVLNGEAISYDLDHIPYARFRFSDKKLESASYFDKAGKKISSCERMNNHLDLDIFGPEGNKTTHRSLDENGDITGTETEYYPTGKMDEVNEYLKGEKNGICTEYYPSGRKRSEIEMINGKPDGKYITYYPSGRIESEGWAKKGQYVGYWNYYDEMGNLSINSYLDNGMLNGYKTEYYENGTKSIEKIFYKDLLLSMKQFDSTGKLLIYDSFPQFNGKFLLLYPNGNKMQEGNYVHGAFDGRFTQYYFDGSVDFIQYYKNGLADSSYISYNYGNKTAIEGQYKAGKKMGLWKYYDEDGQLKSTTEYVNNEPCGPHYFYNDDHKISGEIIFNHGMRDSTATNYDPDGSLLYSIRYDNGEVKGYAYQGKDGNRVSEIKPDKGKLVIKSFFQNGQPSRYCQYVDNTLHGEDLIYFSNGNVRSQDSLEYGISEGAYKEYARNGTLTRIQNYKSDRLHGKWLDYNDKGVLIRDLNYYNNKRHGESKYYSENGKLLETQYYYYGLLLAVKK